MLQWIYQIMDWFFPLRCVSCSEYGNILCEACRKKYILVDPSSQLVAQVSVYSAFLYDKKGILSKSIKQAKYYHTPKLFTILTESSIEAIPDILKNTSGVIIPVPLHFWRKQFRGYNQSDTIAESLVQKFPHWEICHGVKRMKHTEQQAKKTKIERQENVKNAFEIDSKVLRYPKNTPLLVVDDVITTGETMKEIIRVLKENGYINIYGFTLAKA